MIKFLREDITNEDFERIVSEFEDIDLMHQDFVTDIRDDIVDYDEGTEAEKFVTRLEEILENGCQSGTVMGLIYYDDTTSYFNEYTEEIEEFLENCADECLGYLKRNVDTVDILMNNKYAKNYIVWFVYEAMANDLLEMLGGVM